MFSARTKDVFEEYVAFTRFQRILGMSALFYSDGKLQVSRKRLTICIISICGNSLIFMNALRSLRKHLFLVTHWYCYLKTAYSGLLIFSIAASWVRSNMNKRTLNKALSRMRTVDLQMNSFGKELPRTKQSWVTKLIFGLMTVAYFIKASLMIGFAERFHLLILYSPYILLFSFEDNIDRVASLLRIRFLAIQEQLAQCFRMEARKKSVFLEKMILCHHHLSSSSFNIDQYFSVQVISVLTVLFIASFCELYAISIIFKQDAIINKKFLLVEKCLWIIMMMTTTSRICHQFAAISTQAQKFNELLYHLMFDDETHSVSKISKVKLHITMNREVTFTANGFIKLDYTLLHSIIASSTTYLVVLIQFCKG